MLLHFTALLSLLTPTLGACPPGAKWGPGPPDACLPPSDPNEVPASPIEEWFTREMFNDLFPKANIGWGPHPCLPYSYEAFVIAARYFPNFGNESPENGYTAEENRRRDVATFFAHAVQETGENDASLYINTDNITQSHECFYRGGFYNWFEGGPNSLFLPKDSPGFKPSDGENCNKAGKYCISSPELDYWFPCSEETNGDYFKGCYFGRGAIQISYNYNYGQFQNWLHRNGIKVDILSEPNLVITKRDPPLAMLASLWFYMTPQPPKPAMHDIIMGQWNPGPENRAAGYVGAMFGPTSLIINNECNGEDALEPGGPGESRRIKAFKWFTKYFNVPAGEEHLLSCSGMPKPLDQIWHSLSWQPDWSTTWKALPCDCAPAGYGGIIPYFQKAYYPEEFQEFNQENREKCRKSVYDNPNMYSINNETSLCFNLHRPNRRNTDNITQSHECFYRGGFYNWFEGGPNSLFLPKDSPGFKPFDGENCNKAGKYCISSAELDYWFPCSEEKNGDYFKGCYFGRGAIQISYNYNYGQFQNWLHRNGIKVDILSEPNLVITKRDPPLAMLASLWFYMTPQPPKPAMHDIIMGQWNPGPENRAAGYVGAMFGPTSLIINNECNGEDALEPGGPGESRRIKAFKWFTKYFNVPAGEEHLLSCSGMPKPLDQIWHSLSWQPDWSTTWKALPCDCAPAGYGGIIPYFQKAYYPEEFQEFNQENREKCRKSVYDNPNMYSINNETSLCFNLHRPNRR